MAQRKFWKLVSQEQWSQQPFRQFQATIKQAKKSVKEYMQKHWKLRYVSSGIME